jgi:hypothetical protein
MMRLTWLALSVAAVVGIAVGTVTIAFADVDPASDVLLMQDVFVPYQPKVCTQVRDALEVATRRSRAAGYPLKVAVIGSTSDLGAAPQFFGHPSEYAKFLGAELGVFSTHAKRKVTDVPLLVVMPEGIVLWHADPRASDVVKGIAIPRNPGSNALTRAAAAAVPKVATAAGHPVAAVTISSGCSHKTSPWLPFAVPILFLVIGGILLRFVRPRQRTNT